MAFQRCAGYDATTDRLVPSTVEFNLGELRAPGRQVVRACHALRIGLVRIDPATRYVRLPAGL